MGAFPKEFIDRVKARFPDNSEGLHEALELKNPSTALFWMYHYIFDGQVPGYSAKHVVEMLEEGKAEELLAEAREHLTEVALYAEANEYAAKVPHPWKGQA